MKHSIKTTWNKEQKAQKPYWKEQKQNVQQHIANLSGKYKGLGANTSKIIFT